VLFTLDKKVYSQLRGQIKMKLLTAPKSNPKIAKNIDIGVMTTGLSLAPYNTSGKQVCPMATDGCAAACLFYAGRGQMTSVQQARIKKTQMFFKERELFMEMVAKELMSASRKAEKLSLSLGVRMNILSDIVWERIPLKYKGKSYENVMELLPHAKFYDYTKRYNRKDLPDNYSLTFSLAENNDEHAKKALANGMNVAVVFRNENFPKKFMGVPVINGDEHDFRPIDPKPCIVGLKAKGKAKKDTTGFVREV
jgi:hypothetical protein